MKQIFSIAVLIIFGLLSCSSDDGGNGGGGPSTDEIVGTWRMLSFHYEAEINTGEISGTMTGEGIDINDVQVTFQPDGTMETNGNTFKVLLTTTANGSSTTQTLEGQTPLAGSTWRREGNMLYLDSDIESVPEIGYPIANISSNTLHLNGVAVGAPGPETTFDIRFERVN